MENDCIHAVLIEPQLERFRELCGLVDVPLAVTFEGWHYGIFAWEHKFDALRRHMWDAYARARGGELPSWRAVHLFFCLTGVS